MSKSKRSSESTTRVRRTFTEEFKRDAVSLVVDQGYTLAAAARSLGLHPNLIRNWKQKFMSESNGQAVLSEDQEAELKRLREENRKLRMERDILKKATARRRRFDSLCEGFAKESL